MTQSYTAPWWVELLLALIYANIPIAFGILFIIA